MRRLWTLGVFLFALSGCLGEAEWVLDPNSSELGPTSERPVRLSSWQQLSDGLPVGGEVLYTAHLDGTVYSLIRSGAEAGLYSLPSDAAAWTRTGPSLRGAEQLQFLTRIDLSLYVTAADPLAGKGSIYRLDFSSEQWARLEGAPDLPASALVKKGSELLVAAFGDPSGAGLYASSDRGLTWRKRSAAAGAAEFLRRPVRAFVAAPAQQRFFATGEPSAGFGGLYFSDDAGASWTRSDLQGEVLALHAGGAYLLVEVSIGGAYRSDNYGSTWHPMSVGAPARSFFLSSGRAFAGTTLGVSVSDDGGASWRDSSEGLPSAEIRGLYLAGTSLFASTVGRVFVAAVE